MQISIISTNTLTSLDLFIDDPIIGKGIKSFRNNCNNKVYLPNRVCESHPHNFILEILNDTGIIGLMTILIPVLILLINLYKDYLLGEVRRNNISNWIYLSIIMSLLTYFFPFKSTGSFFTTFNSTYIFLIIGFSLGLNEITVGQEEWYNNTIGLQTCAAQTSTAEFNVFPIVVITLGIFKELRKVCNKKVKDLAQLEDRLNDINLNNKTDSEINEIYTLLFSSEEDQLEEGRNRYNPRGNQH